MAEYKVTFLPDNTEIEVEEGITLLGAADKSRRGCFAGPCINWYNSENL